MHSLLLAAGLLAATTSAAAPTPTGTLTGTVTCGPAEEAPASHATIAVEGIDLSTHSDQLGKFTLVGLPALQTFTIDALADPQGSVVTSRYDVTVKPGETLDIGNLDLAVCPQPALAPVETFPLPDEDLHDN